jgi:hypothetical protein
MRMKSDLNVDIFPVVSACCPRLPGGGALL